MLMLRRDKSTKMNLDSSDDEKSNNISTEDGDNNISHGDE
jgi:hypothetical protein